MDRGSKGWKGARWFRTAVVLLGVAAAPGAARADGGDAPAERPVGLLLRMGFDFGGDTIATARYDDGTSTTVKAGGLVHVAGGLLFHPDAPFSVEATFGYKADNATAKNGEIKFDRLPLDLIASYVVARRHRLGAGPTLHLNPKATCSVTGICNESLRFKNAWGFVGQYAYGIPLGSSGAELGARYTVITYAPKTAGVKSVDGSAFGVFFGFWL